MDRVKRLSYEVLDSYKSKFGEDFADNKKVLDQISIIRSKGLKNEVAGYITKYIKNEIRNEKAKQAQIESAKSAELDKQDNDASVVLADDSSDAGIDEFSSTDEIAKSISPDPSTAAESPDPSTAAESPDPSTAAESPDPSTTQSIENEKTEQ